MSFDKDKACSGLAWAAVGVLLFFVSVAAVVRLVDVRQDYAAHIMIAAKITLKSLAHPIAFLRENCYPVWHILTRFTMKFGFGGRSAAAVVTGASILGVWIYAAHYFSRKYQEWNKDVARAASVVLILVAPIWLPFFNHNLIIGQGSPNMLHNPTHLMVRLVAFPCFMLCVAIMDGIGKKSATRLGAGRVIAFSLFVFLTALSKPSFVQMLFPALFFLALLWPVIAMIIKRQSPGPILFRQARTGLDGKTFILLKFRSMHVNAEADRLQATKDDPRKFPFGDWMRRTNVDELPQFWNVLKGEMSIVGPRPHMLAHTAFYSEQIDKYMVRHFVKPGLTGWAQVTGYRGETSELWQMEGRVKRDIWYMEHWSFWLDLRIIWKTIKAMFLSNNKNAC